MYRPKGVLHLLIFVAALAAMAGIPATARADLGLLVPAYFYPTTGGPGGVGDGWAAMAAAANQVNVTAIFDPASGPGSSYNPDYGAALHGLESATYGQAVAYIYTDYGNISLSTVEGEVLTYISQYGSTSPYGNLINGFFLDAMSTDPAEVSYYNQLYTFIKSLSPSYQVIANAGTTTNEAYLTTPTADTIVTYENDVAYYAGTTPPSWVYNYPASQFANIIYDESSVAGMISDINLANQRNVGSVYVTDQSLSPHRLSLRPVAIVLGPGSRGDRVGPRAQLVHHRAGHGRPVWDRRIRAAAAAGRRRGPR